MEIELFSIKGPAILTPQVHRDDRGYFMESYNEKTLIKNGINFHAIQDNQAKSGLGILRGMHYQTREQAQAKLIRVLEGEILDIIVDIRPDSLTYGQHLSVRLSAENQKQFYIPKGFAHGYLSLSEETTVFYKVDQYYAPDHEGGIRYNDPTINIDWGYNLSTCIISEKDLELPFLGNHKPIFGE